MLSCKQSNEDRGYRLSISGAREARARERKEVDPERAHFAAQRVRRMLLLVMRFEMWLEPHWDVFRNPEGGVR